MTSSIRGRNGYGTIAIWHCPTRTIGDCASCVIAVVGHAAPGASDGDGARVSGGCTMTLVAALIGALVVEDGATTASVGVGSSLPHHATATTARTTERVTIAALRSAINDTYI